MNIRSEKKLSMIIRFLIATTELIERKKRLAAIDVELEPTDNAERLDLKVVGLENRCIAFSATFFFQLL